MRREFYFVQHVATSMTSCNYHINEGKGPKTCLTNHKGHHITPLVIYGLRGRHVDTQIHMHTDCAQKYNFKEPGAHLA